MHGGRSLQAYYEAKEFYEQSLRGTDHNQILDVGTGYYGVGRSLITGAKKPSDRLYLYDKDPNIQYPLPQDNAQIVTADDVFNCTLQCSHINFSYVLCTMEIEHSRALLQNLLTQNPSATFFVMDYTLQGRDRQEIIAILCSKSEQKWLQVCGEDEFIRTRSRFSRDSIAQLLQDTGLQPYNTRVLDQDNIRIMIAAKPIVPSLLASAERRSPFLEQSPPRISAH